jgi:hypothetical protein
MPLSETQGIMWLGSLEEAWGMFQLTNRCSAGCFADVKETLTSNAVRSILLIIGMLWMGIVLWFIVKNPKTVSGNTIETTDFVDIPIYNYQYIYESRYDHKIWLGTFIQGLYF